MKFWGLMKASLWFLFLCSNHHDPEHHHSGILVTFWFDSGTLCESTLIYQPPCYCTTTHIALKRVQMLCCFLLCNAVSKTFISSLIIKILHWHRSCSRFYLKDWAQGSGVTPHTYHWAGILFRRWVFLCADGKETTNPSSVRYRTGQLLHILAKQEISCFLCCL